MAELTPNPWHLLQRLDQWWTASSVPAALLTALGVLAAARAAYAILDFVYFYFLKPSGLNRYVHSAAGGDGDGDPTKQPWALVTGATDGIGKAFAHELACRGFNVVAHGRNAAKLAAVEAQLRAAHPGRAFRTLRADAGRVACASCFEQSGGGGGGAVVDFDAIVASLSDIHLTVLVSNAGGAARPVYRTLDEMSAAELAANVSLNALFPLHLLARLIPTLAANSPALVIAVGSLADNGLPLLGSYGPSKSFLMSMAGCAARDMRIVGRDVEVVGMRAGRVTGVSHQKTRGTLMLPDAGTWARAALARVGCGRAECVPYWGHALQQKLVVEMMPVWFKERLFMRIMSGLRAEEREQLRREVKEE